MFNDRELLALLWATSCGIYSLGHLAEDQTITEVRHRIAGSMRVTMGHKKYRDTLTWLAATKHLER